MMRLDLQGAWPILTDLTLKSSLLCVIAMICSASMRRASAAARHFLWLLLTGSLLVLPALCILLPHWNVTVMTLRKGRDVPAHPPRPSSAVMRPPVLAPSLLAGALHRETGNRASLAPGQTGAAPPGSAMSPASVESHSISSLLPGGRTIDVWMLGVAGWFMGCALLLIKLVAGLLATWRLRRSGLRVQDKAHLALLAGAQRSMDVHRDVILLQASPEAEIQAPVTFGALRAAIAIPAALLDWPESRLRPILLHEMAHIARFDWAVEILARIVRSLYWFNPLVTLSLSRLHSEGERACDDRVLLAGVGATVYADTLMEILKNMKTPHRSMSAALSMARPPIETRLRAILSRETRRTGLTRSLAITGGIVMSAVLLPLAVVHVGAGTPAGVPQQPRVEANKPTRHATAQKHSAADQVASYRARTHAMQAQIARLHAMLIHERARNQRLEHAMRETEHLRKQALDLQSQDARSVASVLSQAFREGQTGSHSRNLDPEALKREIDALLAKRPSLEVILKRNEDLNREGFVSKSDLLSSRLALDQNLAQVNHLQEELNSL